MADSSIEATTEKEEELPPKYDGPLVDHPPYPTPKKILSRPKKNNGSTGSPIRDEKVVPRVEPLPRVVNTIEEKGGSDRVPESSVEGSETKKDRNTDRLHDGSRDVIDDLQVDHQQAYCLWLT